MIKPVSFSDISIGNLTHSNKVCKNNVSNVFEQKVEEQSLVSVSKQWNVTRVSFKGKLANPTQPAIQMKVRGVSHHQEEFGSVDDKYKDKNVQKLADSEWYDGKPLDFEIRKFSKQEKILIKDPKFGEIGRVPDSIAPSLAKVLKKHGKDFQFTLSNVIAGTSKGAPTIGLRVNLAYTGKDAVVRKKAEKIFDFLLNSEEPEIKEMVMIYQPKSSPIDVLTQMFNVEAQKNGTKAVHDLQATIDNIASEINNPENKNILLLGHCLPDGDTIGCVLGMHAAIKSAYPEKNVQCSIDDNLPGLYRDKLPGIENIKRPYNAQTIKDLEKNIKRLQSQEQTSLVKSQLDVYKNELAHLKRNEIYFDPEVKDGELPQRYDLVILMDIATPTRFSSAYKEYIENAKNVIFIDHHPYRPQEWKDSKATSGIDMLGIQNKNLALVVPSVPAATELVTVIADEANLINKTMRAEEYSKQFVAGIISGTSSDTSCFTRTANYTTEDVAKPVKERPNFLPEGLSKWLIARIGSVIDKKWLREHVVYDIADKTSSFDSLAPREKMVEYSINGQQIFPETGFGVISIDYAQMYDVWESARQTDSKVSFIDVQNSFKYSEIMGDLREAPTVFNSGPYESVYQDDKISVLLIQDKEKGRIDVKSNLADKNGIRMSFRSQDGTEYASMLASLFNGGGHGSAAGGRLDLDGVTINSKIAMKIDGKKEYNPFVIYSALMENQRIKNDKEIPLDKKVTMQHKFEPCLDENGETIQNFINSIVAEIRNNPS